MPAKGTRLSIGEARPRQVSRRLHPEYPHAIAISPIRPTDEEARALARQLLAEARYGALATIAPATGAPTVSRIAVATTPEGTAMTLISDLSAHTKALRANSACALLLGEPGQKGDPLSHPRLTLHATARFIDRSGAEHAPLLAHYLTQHPKARLYTGFADFSFVVFDLKGASLNGGFGKAYELVPADLTP